MIEKGRYCSNGDSYYDDNGHGGPKPLWWFQQGEICLRFHHCYCYECNVLNDVCKPHAIYLFPHTDAHSLTLSKSSHIAKFLSLFQAKRTNKGTDLDDTLKRMYMPMFYPNVSIVNQSLRSFAGLVLRVYERYIRKGFWTHQGTVQVLNVTLFSDVWTIFNTFVLSTKESLLPDQLTCSSTYFQCNDGTCIDEHLVCDGRQHCMMGEDEQECTKICTAKVSCALNCSYMNKCYCLRGFFQCGSGGCIPVGKLCDRVYNCKDGSDEPVTCEFDSAQIQRSNIEEHWNVLRQRCLQGTDPKSFIVNPFYLNPPEVTN